MNIPPPPPEVTEAANDVDARRMEINKERIENFGPTESCPGCRDIIREVKCSGQNDTCRTRFEDLMRQRPKGNSQIENRTRKWQRLF